MKPQTKKFKMAETMACAAAIRPDYCKFETNMCCFGCEFNEECTKYAREQHIMVPCTHLIFDVDEQCEFAV